MAQAAGLDDPRGGFTALEHLGQDGFSGVLVDDPLFLQNQQFGQRFGTDPQAGQRFPGLVDQPEEFPGDPISRGLGRDVWGRGHHGLKIVGHLPIGDEHVGVIDIQTVFLLESLELGLGQFRQTGADFFHPGLVDDERGQVRLGEVAVILGFFFAPLGEGRLAGLVPAARLLDDGLALAQPLALTFDFVGDGALQSAEAVQVLDFGAFAQGHIAGNSNGDVGLKAEHAFLHVARVDAQIAEDVSQRFGVGARFGGGTHIRFGDNFQQGDSRPVQVHQAAGR